jgi:hypothetical protein
MTLPVTTAAPARDPLQTLRAYHALAPWSLRDLAGLAGTILEASATVPVNVAARARPSERTIRFYVARGLVDPPEGRGTAAVYRYRHLLQVLGIKLRQMDGASLDTVLQEFGALTGDTLERRVATALGPGVPTPDELGEHPAALPTRGRSARALRGRPDEEPEGEEGVGDAPSMLVRRVPLAPGAELSLDASHPLFRHAGADRTVARAVAAALEAVAKELGGR